MQNYPLGVSQKGTLRALQRHGVFTIHAGWLWKTKGLVIHTKEPNHAGLNVIPGYRINPLAEAEIEKLLK